LRRTPNSGRPRTTRPGNRRGIETVEFALVAPVLIFLMFGIAELGMLFHDYQILGTACREGSRVASLGGLTSSISARIDAAAIGLTAANITRTMEFASYDSATGWTSWTPLGNLADLTGNDAPKLAQIRVTLTYSHQLMMGNLFSMLSTSPGGTGVTLRSRLVMLRE
jgi:Flp pilus assembly protein TadG